MSTVISLAGKVGFFYCNIIYFNRLFVQNGQLHKMWKTSVSKGYKTRTFCARPGITHRDVKPENIIITKNKAAAYLVDFGIALTADDIKRITETGYVVGTWAYMSPEQRNGEELDVRSDIWSLGLNLYESLCGHLPPVGQAYESLSKTNEAIPPSIDDLIKLCIVPDKNRRLSSPKGFAEKLQTSFRTDIPLSLLLTEGRLHELHAALQNMSAEEFSAKPIGQKLLIINRTRDLIRADKPQLQKPTAEMIRILLHLVIGEPPELYKIIVDAAYEWGYEKLYGKAWYGDEDVRDGIINAAREAPELALSVLSTSLLEFIEKVGLDDKAGWYYHDLRETLISLLANSHLGDSAYSLASLYNKLNEMTH